MTDQKTAKPKKLYLEAARILASLCVIFNHTEDRGYLLFGSLPDTSPLYWLCMLMSVACKVAVPLFFMLSGALLLQKEETIADVYRKRIPRFVVILLGISLVYELDAVLLHGQTPDWTDFLRRLFHTEVTGHLWYLYSYIAFLITLPLLRAMVKGMTGRHFMYLFCLVEGINLISLIEQVTSYRLMGLCDNLKPQWILFNIFIYPVMGYYLEEKLDFRRISGKKLAGLWGAGLAGMIAVCIVTHRIIPHYGWPTDVVFQNFVLLEACTLYLTLKWLFTRFTPPRLLKKALLTLGPCAFIVYLIHIQIMKSPVRHLLVLFTDACRPAIVGTLLYTLTVGIIGYLIAFLLRLIPPVRKWL